MIKNVLKELRARLGLTQQQLAVRAGLSVRGYAAYEGGERSPEPGPLAVLASIAGEEGHQDLANRLVNSLLQQLRLHERETILGRFDVPTKEVIDHERRFKYNEPCGPPRGMLLIVRHGREETSFLEAVFYAFSALRSKDEAARERARAALKQLAQAMGVEV
jgi:transcriptional regulator with XRE-family HTH domain